MHKHSECLVSSGSSKELAAKLNEVKAHQKSLLHKHCMIDLSASSTEDSKMLVHLLNEELQQFQTQLRLEQRRSNELEQELQSSSAQNSRLERKVQALTQLLIDKDTALRSAESQMLQLQTMHNQAVAMRDGRRLTLQPTNFIPVAKHLTDISAQPPTNKRPRSLSREVTQPRPPRKEGSDRLSELESDLAASRAKVLVLCEENSQLQSLVVDLKTEQKRLAALKMDASIEDGQSRQRVFSEHSKQPIRTYLSVYRQAIKQLQTELKQLEDTQKALVGQVTRQFASVEETLKHQQRAKPSEFSPSQSSVAILKYRVPSVPRTSRRPPVSQSFELASSELYQFITVQASALEELLRPAELSSFLSTL